jgi:hypothetical protein
MAEEEVTRVFTLTDAPKKPNNVMVLKDKPTYWVSIKEKWSKSFEAIKTEHQQRLNENKDSGLTQEEADRINEDTEHSVTEATHEMGQSIIEVLKVNPGDTREEAEAKKSAAKAMVDWLQQLGRWLVKKLTEIFSAIKEAMQWCMDKTKELFQYLWSLLN